MLGGSVQRYFGAGALREILVGRKLQTKRTKLVERTPQSNVWEHATIGRFAMTRNLGKQVPVAEREANALNSSAPHADRNGSQGRIAGFALVVFRPADLERHAKQMFTGRAS
jgi:hypothetical protein